MLNRFGWLLLLLLSVPVAAHADEQDVAVDVVACVNAENGYLGEIDGEEWELAQAILRVPDADESVRLVPNYYFVDGRSLGYHGTWKALLHLGARGWKAFETRIENERLKGFAASFVPNPVIHAFAQCGVAWGGHWTEKYPWIRVEQEPLTLTPLSLTDFLRGEDLMSPKSKD